MINTPYLILTKEDFCVLLEKLKVRDITVKYTDPLSRNIIFYVILFERGESLPDYRSDKNVANLMSNYLGLDDDNFARLIIHSKEVNYTQTCSNLTLHATRDRFIESLEIDVSLQLRP